MFLHINVISNVTLLNVMSISRHIDYCGKLISEYFELLGFVQLPFKLLGTIWAKTKLGGLNLSRRDLDRDLDLDAKKVSVLTVEIISTVFKS